MGFFSKLFGCHHKCKKTTSGDIILGCGLHEITIKVCQKPCKVFFCIKDPYECICTCHGDINKIGITITEEGFVLYADIKTNTCLVEWTCEF